jgi:RNA polymerase sigma-70 factor, ECF subfamily
MSVHNDVVSEGTTPDIGTVASFDALYRREYAGLVRLAFVLTGRLDVAEELVQDAFEAAHRRWPKIATYDQPGAWVRRVVLQRCIGRHRRLQVETRGLLRLARRPEQIDDLPDRDHELMAAIRALPARQAQAIALVLLEDRSVYEAAELLGCSPVTVRTHLHRGRSALAARLKLDANSEEETS